MNGTAILKNAPMIGAMLAERRSVADKHALHDQEVRGPVTEADHEAQAEDNARPVDAHGVVCEVAHACATCACSRRKQLRHGDLVRSLP